MLVDLDVAGRAVLVVGAGPAALGRIAALRDSGAIVTVVARDAVAAIADLAERELLVWRQRELEDADFDGAALVVAATGGVASDRRVRERAATLKLLCVMASGEAAATRRTGGGRVVLVGGGPGDPGLITVAGLAAVRAADVVVTDRLAPLAVLADVKPGAEVVDVAKIPGGRTTPQEEINRLLIEHATSGKLVVRLKGGDNFVFGRGGEEWQACAQAGVPVQIIPGVSSAIAAPALAGIPLTHRTANQGFTVITGHVRPGDVRSTIDYAALARAGTALVVLMGVGTLEAIAMELIRYGMDPETPAATVADGTMPSQRVVRATLLTIAEATHDAGIRPPAVTVIGSVAAFDAEKPPRWSWE
ncbi:MAG: uroporphyrinogen-III C-methyltransferase [Nakamurella sp.]